MSAEIMDKANELAEAITKSAELTALRAAETVMQNDPQAMEIIQEFQKTQQKVYNIQTSGGELNEQDKQEIEQMEQKMNANPVIKAYIDASEKFDELMRSVNLMITRALTGGQGGCDCGSDCGPDCGSECSGCS